MRSFDARAVGTFECRAWDLHDPLLARERALLVRSYAVLLAAVHR